MEIIIKREDFLRSLSRTQGVVEKRSIMPILENVLLEAKSGRINFTATDLEVGVHGSCEAEVKREGKIAVLAKKVLEIARELPEEKVSLRLRESVQGGNWIEIACGKAVFNITSMDPKEYPALPIREDMEFFQIDSEKIRDMIRKTIFAASIDEKRYNLNGVFFEKDKRIIRMVATDGHRLSLIEREDLEDGSLSLEKGVIFPRKGLNELKRILDEEKQEKRVYVGFRENNAVFKTENISVIMRLIDSEFPDYRRLVPAEDGGILRINRGHLLSSLRRVSLLSGSRLKAVRFSISPGKVELRASSPEYGEAYDEIPMAYEGSEVEVAFNASYMIEVLNVLDSQEVVVKLKDATAPAVVKPSDDDRHTCIIMPMRI